MATRNKARKSTGGTPTKTPPKVANRLLRQRVSTQAAHSSTAQGDSSDSDTPTQRLTRNRNPTIQSTAGPSGLSSRASTSRANVDSDDDEQPTLRLSKGRGRNFKRVQFAESSDSGNTTSDSDEAPGRFKSPQKNRLAKKKKVVRRKNSSEDSEQDVQPDSTTNITSTSKNVSSLLKSSSSPNKTIQQSRNIPSLVNKCVYFLLVADQKKCPIKKTDILKHVFNAAEKKLYSEVLKEAGAVLKKTYGMEIVVPETRKGEYMLINILSHELGIQELIDYSPSELQKRGLIFYVLTIIYMNEQSITDAELTTALKPLGIDLNARLPHPLFGDVRSYLTKELVKQNYLEHKCINKEPPQYEFSWGERAYQEVDKKDLLEFVCQIMGDVRPEEWIIQYNDAMARRQEPAA